MWYEEEEKKSTDSNSGNTNSTWNWGLSEVANLRPHDADDGRASCHFESLAELNEGLGYCVVRGYM